MNKIKKYFSDLSEHPGVPVATAMTLIFVAGMLVDKGCEASDMTTGDRLVIGLVLSLLVWVPVLITNLFKK